MVTFCLQRKITFTAFAKKRNHATADLTGARMFELQDLGLPTIVLNTLENESEIDLQKRPSLNL